MRTYGTSKYIDIRWWTHYYIVIHDQLMFLHVHTSRYMCLHAHTYRYPCLPVANKTSYMSLHSSTRVYTRGLFRCYIHIHASTSAYIKRYPQRVTLCMFRIHHRTRSYIRTCAHMLHRNRIDIHGSTIVYRRYCDVPDVFTSRYTRLHVHTSRYT
jgi:hypothetical protein